jgi:hypothetical protein
MPFPQGWPPACWEFSGTPCNSRTLSAILARFESAGVAQLVEHLICNQRVGGSIPSASSTRKFAGNEAEQILSKKIDGLVSLDTSPFCVFPKRALDPKLKDFATIS